MTKFKKIHFFISLFCIFSISISIVGIKYVQYQEYVKGGNILYPTDQVLGISTMDVSASIDFSKQITTSNPEIFGGAHGPSLDHQAAWDMLKTVGITTIRRDFYMDYEVPQNITLNDYITNKNNVQNISTWNWNKINETDNIYKNAQKRGLKTIGIVAYSPKWLTYSNTNFGVPKDWNVFEDIVKKTYRIHRKNLNYVEIWNEPNLRYFIDVTGSNLTPENAYLQIFLHATKAIREVDHEENDGKQITIGGGVLSGPDATNFIKVLIENSEAVKNLNFVSFHSYGSDQPSQDKIKNLLSSHKLSTIPIFLTEWNQSENVKENNPYNYTDIAIPFVGSKLIQFMKMGLAGANYFSTTYSDPAKPKTVFNVFGIYTLVNGKLKPFPQTKAFAVLSQDAKLGYGQSNIYNTIYDPTSGLEIAGFQNVDKHYGLAVSNPTNSIVNLETEISGLDLSKFTKITAFEASKTSDVTKPKGTLTVNNTFSGKFRVIVPPLSVVTVLVN